MIFFGSYIDISSKFWVFFSISGPSANCEKNIPLFWHSNYFSMIFCFFNVMKAKIAELAKINSRVT